MGVRTPRSLRSLGRLPLLRICSHLIAIKILLRIRTNGSRPHPRRIVACMAASMSPGAAELFSPPESSPTAVDTMIVRGVVVVAACVVVSAFSEPAPDLLSPQLFITVLTLLLLPVNWRNYYLQCARRYRVLCDWLCSRWTRSLVQLRSRYCYDLGLASSA